MKNATSTDRAADVFRAAAFNLESQCDVGAKYQSPYSCDHIGAVLGLYTGPTTDKARATFRVLIGRYETMFRPEGDDLYWHGWEDAHNERVLALCFMAAMVEAGDA